MGIYLASGVLFLVGAAILLFVVESLIETVVFMQAATKTEGRVIYFAHSRNSDGRQMYLPIFEYRTNDGSVYRYTSTVASSPPSYKVGETATLFYLRKNPQNAKVDSFIELWLFKTISGLIALACLGGAALLFFSAK